MSVLLFLVIAGLSGTASLLVRTRRRWSTAFAITGLALMAAAATTIEPAAAIRIGGTMLASSDWLRLYALLGSIVGLLLVAVDASALHEPDVPGTLVLGIAAAAAAQGGVVLAEALSDSTLRRLFAGLLVLVAAQVAWRSRRTES